MEAIVQSRYGPPSVLQSRDLAVPHVDETDVLVRVRAASVGAWDWHFLRGDPYVMRLVGLGGFGLRGPRNAIRGEDMAGTVEAVGSAVTSFRPGEAVYGEASGTHAAFACAEPSSIAPMPSNLTFEESAAVPIAGCTALIGLRDKGGLQAGQRVLIIGAAGGVGTFAVQIARALGARVTGVCSGRDLELVRSLGAEHVIDYRTTGLGEMGSDYDLIFQLAGTRSATQLRRLLAPTGTLVLSSGEGSKWFGPTFRLARGLLPRTGDQGVRTFVAKVTRADLDTLTELIEDGSIKPVIDRSYPLGSAAKAFERFATGHSPGKIVLTMP